MSEDARTPSAGEWIHRKPGSPYWHDKEGHVIGWADTEAENNYYQVDVWNEHLEATMLPPSQWSTNKHNNIQRLKQVMEIYDVLEKHGVEHKTVRDRVRFKCPFHNDHNPSMDFWTTIKAFRCWGCGATGDIIDLHYQLSKQHGEHN